MNEDGGASAGARPLCLLARAYCHLCDDMLAALVRLLEGRRDVDIRVIDVDAHPALESRYGERVPVLMVGDPRDEGVAPVELCHYRLEPARVLAALQGR